MDSCSILRRGERGILVNSTSGVIGSGILFGRDKDISFEHGETPLQKNPMAFVNRPITINLILNELNHLHLFKRVISVQK